MTLSFWLKITWHVCVCVCVRVAAKWKIFVTKDIHFSCNQKWSKWQKEIKWVKQNSDNRQHQQQQQQQCEDDPTNTEYALAFCWFDTIIFNNFVFLFSNFLRWSPSYHSISSAMRSFSFYPFASVGFSSSLYGIWNNIP